MGRELALAIESIRHGPVRPLAWWKETIARLVAEFGRFIGEECCHADDARIDAEHASFCLWLWSVPRSEALLSTSWSCVLAGGRGAGDEFVITVDAFVFHSRSKQRLRPGDGRSFLQFSFDVAAGEWRYHGWITDDYGEWEDVADPDAE